MMNSDIRYNPMPSYNPAENREYDYLPYEQTAFRDTAHDVSVKQMHNAQMDYNHGIMPVKTEKYSAGNWFYVGAGGIVFALAMIGILIFFMKRGETNVLS